MWYYGQSVAGGLWCMSVKGPSYNSTTTAKLNRQTEEKWFKEQKFKSKTSWSLMSVIRTKLTWYKNTAMAQKRYFCFRDENWQSLLCDQYSEPVSTVKGKDGETQTCIVTIMQQIQVEVDTVCWWVTRDKRELQMKKLLSAMLSPSADGRSFGFLDHSTRYTDRLLAWNHEFIHLLQKYSKQP